jgi:hypothetical protein
LICQSCAPPADIAAAHAAVVTAAGELTPGEAAELATVLEQARKALDQALPPGDPPEMVIVIKGGLPVHGDDESA